MNNFKRYTFSEEVKDNLVDFLRVVQKNPSTTYDKIWETVLPKNQELLKELNVCSVQHEMVIDLTEDEDPSKSVEVIDDILVEDVKQELNTSLNQNVADSLKEYLCSEENLDDIFRDILANYNDDEIGDVFALLSAALSSELVCKLGECILGTSCEEKTQVTRLYLKYLLLPKLFTDSNKQLVSIFIKFLDGFLNITAEEFSCKLNSDIIEYPQYILNTLNTLATKHKQQLLRNFMSSTTKLHQQHFSIVDALLYKDLQIETLQNMMDLLTAVSLTYSDDKVFGKMLLNILKHSGNSVAHFRQQLNTIVGAHQSIWKNKLQKEVRDCLQNTSMLSQSLRY